MNNRLELSRMFNRLDGKSKDEDAQRLKKLIYEKVKIILGSYK